MLYIKMNSKISWFNYLALFTIILSIHTVSSQPVKNISNFEDVNTNLSTQKLVRTKRNSILLDPQFRKIVGIAIATFLCHSPMSSRTNTETKQKIETCKINVKQLDPTHALIINPSDHTKFLYPDDNGDIVFMQGEPVFLSCADPKNLFSIIPNTRYETFICVCDQIFYGKGQKYSFDSLTCNHMPKYDVVDRCEIEGGLNNRDGEHYHNFDIGFFTDDKPNFLKTVQIFYSDDSATTVYSKSIISKSLAGGQITAKNVPFDSTHCCKRKTMNMDEVYDQQTQMSSFEFQLPSQKQLPANKRYVQKGTDYIFTRGQLTPPSSMVYTAAGASTFAYLNVVPEWQIINQGNWIRIENHINEIAKRLQKDLTVITGATYPLKLRDTAKSPEDEDYDFETENMKQMFLYAARPNRESVVQENLIPLNLFKIVIEPESNNGVVFVTMNNPHATYMDFDNLCDGATLDMTGVTMPKDWQPLKRVWGNSYMCKVQDFLRNANIPLSEHITAEELLYIPRPYEPITFQPTETVYYIPHEFTFPQRTTMGTPTTTCHEPPQHCELR